MNSPKHERKCFCCGEIYYYCGQGCKGDAPNEPWRMLFHDENCKAAYELWQSYRGKEISEADLKKVLENMDLTKILASDTALAKDFKDILKTEDKSAAKKTTKKKKDDDMLVQMNMANV